MTDDVVPLYAFSLNAMQEICPENKIWIYEGGGAPAPLPTLNLITNFFLAGGATDSDGGAGGAVGKGLRSEGVLSGKGLRAVLSGRGVRAEPSGRGLRIFWGVGAAEEAAGADATGFDAGAAVMVPLERVDEGLGVTDDPGPGDGRDEGDELLVEDDLVRWYGAGFGGKLSMTCTLVLSTLSLTIFRGRSS